MANNASDFINHLVDFAQTLIIAFFGLLHMGACDRIMMKQNAPFLLDKVDQGISRIDKVFQLILDF